MLYSMKRGEDCVSKDYKDGIHVDRLSRSDVGLEIKYAEAWKELPIDVLDQILRVGDKCPLGFVTSRDEQIAATIIQWLGTDVGQDFIFIVQND